MKGVIYDVSNSSSYQAGGPYCNFTGHDASVSLAKMSHDKEHLDKDGIVALNEDEQKILDDWVVYFNNKYHIVGKLLKGTKTEWFIHWFTDFLNSPKLKHKEKSALVFLLIS